jgi:hypothetical protein
MAKEVATTAKKGLGGSIAAERDEMEFGTDKKGPTWTLSACP